MKRRANGRTDRNGGKPPKDELFSIMIFSAGDARKKPIKFTVHKKTVLAAVVVGMVAVGFTALFTHIAAARAECYSNQIVQLQSTLDEQSAQIRVQSSQIASLEKAVEISDTEDAGDSPEAFANMKVSRSVSSGVNGMQNGKIELVDWFQGGSTLFARYAKATVIYVQTGLSFNVRRIGGHFHADSEPQTREDTAIMKSIYGGRWSWNRRAIVLCINGRYIAASMNGMPHGGDPSQSNGFPGHFCIHFLNSRVHASGKECNIHQSAVMYAFENGNSVI